MSTPDESAATAVRSERDDGSTTPLERCPFCFSDLIRPHRVGAVFWQECAGCECEGPVASTREAAIAAWNRRPSPSPEDVERVARAICCPSGHCHIVQINERAETARHYLQPWPCCWRQHKERAHAAMKAYRACLEGSAGRGCK